MLFAFYYSPISNEFRAQNPVPPLPVKRNSVAGREIAMIQDADSTAVAHDGFYVAKGMLIRVWHRAGRGVYGLRFQCTRVASVENIDLFFRNVFKRIFGQTKIGRWENSSEIEKVLCSE